MCKLFLIIIVMAIVVAGCSGASGIPSTPGMEALTSLNSTERSHALWGLWQGTIDPAAKTIDLTPLRIADFHLNALPFLEPPPLLNLTLESLEFNGDFIEADIGLRHPFLGLTEFTGFDVCGVFISNGSVSGFSDAGIVMAGQGDTRLVNPDGITRWWNPAEFPHGKTMFGYKEGLLGTPDSTADYNSTLNPYKYFCDALGPNDPLSTVPLAKRGMFSPGQKNIRHYTLHLGAGLIFNYAVDASWEFPQGSKPWIAPDDFSPSANRPEAWRADVTEVSNTLWNDGSSGGGSLSLSIDVYDWFNPELNTMTVESPNNFDPVGPIGPSGGGVGYSTFEVDITNATPQQQDSIDLLITVNCEEEGYGGFLPGKTVAAYFLHTAVPFRAVTETSTSSPQGILILTDETSVRSERSAALHTAAAVVPVVNPRRNTVPDAVRTENPRATSSS